jgi:DNA-directed RNA polymerase subunit H (RpoH/RPB5)
MSSKIKLTNNIVKMRKPESSPENSDSENDTESSSDVNVSDDEVEWVTESESESYKPKRSGSGGCGHDNKRRKFVVESDDDDEESESESEEDDDDDDDERDCGKNSDDRANKNRPSMSVVKLDDKQKKRYKSSYKRNDSESENDSDRESDRDGTDERDASGHNSKKRKNKNVSPKNRSVQSKKPCVNSVIAKKVGDKHDEDDSDSDEDYKPPSVNRKPKSSRENKNNRDVSDISIILAALDNEFLEDEGLVIDSENDECNSEDEETFMHETYKRVEYPSNPETDKNKMCVDVERKKTAGKSRKGGKPDKKSVEPDVQEDVDAEYKSLVDLKNILVEKLTRNPKNKFVLKSLKKCKEEIVSLIKRSRTKNTTDYYNLVKNESTGTDTDEFSFFRKKLSNTQQKNIVKQLKDINDHIQVGKPHRLMLLETDIPIKYKATVMQKLNILESMDSSDQEYYKIKNWVDTFMRIPFMRYKNLSVNIDDGIDKCSEFIENSRNILDDCVYGMNDAKIQILQLLGQWVSNPSALGSAIGIYGPPGTAKTTIVKNGISKILGREFAFISLGGAGDSSFLDGHSYTYEGSSWGKIIQILIDSKCMNPVIYFDELEGERHASG